MVDHIAMVYILSVCVCGLVMVIYVVSFNSKSCSPFSTGELINPDCLKKSMCVSVREIDKSSGKCLSDRWRMPVCLKEKKRAFSHTVLRKNPIQLT